MSFNPIYPNAYKKKESNSKYCIQCIKSKTVNLVPQFAKLLKQENELSELKPYHKSSTNDNLHASYLSFNFLLTMSLAASLPTVFPFVDLSNNVLSTRGPSTTVPQPSYLLRPSAEPLIQYLVYNTLTK